MLLATLRLVASLPAAAQDARPFDGAVRGTPPPLVEGERAKGQGEWVLKFRFGPTFTDYYPSDIRLRTSRLQGQLHTVEITERNSMDYYRFWESGHGLKFIDEPSNSFILSAENLKHRFAVNLVVFHPKFLVVSEGTNGSVRFQGTLDGRPVDGRIDLNELFGEYRLTRGLINVQLQFEKIIPLAEGSGSSLVYAPGVGGGVFLGNSVASYRDPAGGEPRVHTQPYELIGEGFSVSNRLTFSFLQERLSATLAHQLGVAGLSYEVLDGTAEQSLHYQTLTFTIGVKLATLGGGS